MTLTRGTRVLNRRRRDEVGIVQAVFERDGHLAARVWWYSRRTSTCRAAALVAVEEAETVPYDWRETPF